MVLLSNCTYFNASTDVTKKKKLANNLSYFPDDEDSEWLANIDLSLLDKSKEEKQLDDNDFPRRIPFHFA